MPCRDDRDSYAAGRHCDQQEISDLTKRNDELAQMLCGLCTRIEHGTISGLYLISDDKALNKWWTDHKKFDAERLKKERAERVQQHRKMQALSKLSPEERELLGLPKGLY